MNRKRLKLVLGLGFVLLAMLSCGGSSETPTPIVIVVTAPPSAAETTVEVEPTAAVEPTAEIQPTAEVVAPPPSEAGIEILEATFAHGLSEQMEPVDPGNEFAPNDPIYLALTIKGRPEEGIVSANFYWGDMFIAEAGTDLADVNSGLIFSVGEDTYAGFTLTHEEPLPLGESYHVEVFYDDQPLGDYPFRVGPPPEAIPSQVTAVTLALGADENYDPIDPTTTFAQDQEVHLVGEGDLGEATWLQADWYVDGELDEAGTRSLSLEENIPGAGFVFSYLPEGGWPAGEHFVVLVMNEQEVGRYVFTIAASGSIEPSGGAIPFDAEAFWNELPAPDDAEGVEVIEGYDVGFVTAMTEPEVFDAYAGVLSEQGWQQQAPTEAMETLPHQVWRTEGAELLIEIRGLDTEGRTIVWMKLTTEETR
jgi:hypothetical protein